MPGTHGDTGPSERRDSQDKGCPYSYGKRCQACPYISCVEDLEQGDRIKFGHAYSKDGAQDYWGTYKLDIG